MLTVEKSLLGKFDEHELAKCISAHGWQAALPDALKDHQLLLLSDQLRALLAGKGWNSKHGDGSAALSLGLLLLSKAGASLPEDLSREADMASLHEVLTLLSISVDHEIVSRLLRREDGTSGAGFMQSLRELVQLNSLTEPFSM